MRWRLAVVLVATTLGCRVARRANVLSRPVDRHGTLPSGGGIPDAGRAFDDRVYDYRFTIDPAELARLDAEPARFDDEALHVPAALVVDGEDLGAVGVRYKGAWGTFRSCLPNADGTGPAEPYRPIAASGCPPVAKFSYKVLFDAYASAKRFHGLARMNLHNLIRDPSKLHERLAFELFRDLGIATARSTFARVTVNGVYKGLYAATEDIGNRRFLADHWPADRHGRLYKQGWPRVTDPAYWEQALSTPKRVDDHQAIVAFARDVRGAGGDPDRLAAALARWSDPEWLARYMAVDTAVRNVDGITKLSCRPGAPDDCVPNNYFWYQTSAGKFLLLPWDLDYTWRVSVRQNQLPPWDLPVPSPGLASCAVRITVDGAPHAPAPCDPILRGIAVRRDLYLQAVRQLLAHPDFSVATLRAKVDRWAAMIRPSVAADAAIPRSGSKEWNAQLALLKDDLATLRARMEAVAAGEPYRPFPPSGPWVYVPAPPAPRPAERRD
jgi:spore coat protein H